VSYRNWDSTSPQATDFTCLPTPGTRGTPAQLRVRGCIESFGTSANTSAGALKVAFFRADDLVTPILTVDAAADNIVYPDLSVSCKYHGGYDTGTATGTTTLPTETPLVAKVFEPAKQFYVDTYRFGVFLRVAAGVTEVKRQNVDALLKTDYQLIPTYAGL